MGYNSRLNVIRFIAKLFFGKKVVDRLFDRDEE